MQFIDSHAHINDEAFDADRAEVIRRVFTKGQVVFGLEITEARKRLVGSLRQRE